MNRFKPGDIIRVAQRTSHGTRALDFPEIISGALHIVLEERNGAYKTNIPSNFWIPFWFESQVVGNASLLEKIIWGLPLGD